MKFHAFAIIHNIKIRIYRQLKKQFFFVKLFVSVRGVQRTLLLKNRVKDANYRLNHLKLIIIELQLDAT